MVYDLMTIYKKRGGFFEGTCMNTMSDSKSDTRLPIRHWLHARGVFYCFRYPIEYFLIILARIEHFK
jgi:hypothetical protein